MTTFLGELRPVDDGALGRALSAGGNDVPPVVPRFRSRFGGLWTDLSTAHAMLESKVAAGWVTDDEAALLRQFIDDGYAVLEGAVPAELCDRLLEEIDATLAGRLPRRKAEWWSEEGKHVTEAGPATMREAGAKMLDLHFTSPATQEAIFQPRLVRFLNVAFERPPLAFQSLTCMHGTQQPIHQDTAFVRVSSPLEFVASWIALEDIVEGSGELEYYPGSHAIEEELFDGRYKWVPEDATVVPNYSESLHDRARQSGLALKRFLPKKGDVLVWAADLMHGGRGDVKPGRTRKSHVTHYCPLDQAPMYYLRDETREKVESFGGGYVCEQRYG